MMSQNRKRVLPVRGDLTGRTIGYHVTYRAGGEDMSRWGTITGWEPNKWAGLIYYVTNRHTGKRCFVRASRVHTVMPESFDRAEAS